MTTTSKPDPAELLVHAPFIRGLARATLRGDTHVEDAVQETWLAALGDRAPRNALGARPWLARVVRNVSYTFLRRDTRRARREERAARQDHVPSAAEIAAREETRQNVVRALLAIGEPYRATLILRYYEDLPPREVAERRGVPVETARTHIKRGLAKLRQELDREYGDRRTWGLAVLPLLDLPGPALAASSVGIGLGVKLASLLLLPLMLLAGFLVLRGERDEHPSHANRAASSGTQPVLIGRAQPPGATNEVSPIGRCVLRGRVTCGGAPVAVRVELRRMEARKNLRLWRMPLLRVPALHQITSAADGTFEIQDLPPSGTYEVRAVAPGGTWTFANFVLLANGQVQTLDLQLPTGTRTIVGRAEYANGRPFRGAILCQTGTTFGTHTEKDGRFRLAGVPAGPLTLSAHKPDAFIIRHRWVEEPGDAALQPFVVDRGVTLRRGRVISAIDGRGIAGVLVKGIKTRSTESGVISVTAQAVSAAGGGYTLPAIEGMSIRALAAGYAEWYEPNADTEGVIRVRPGARIEGTVRLADGTPIPDPVTVTAVSLGATPTDGNRSVEARTSEGGRFQVDAVPGRILLYAHGASWASPELATIQRGRAIESVFVVQAGATVHHDLSVVRTATLEGRVLDGEGNPLVGALVSLHHVNAPPKHKALGVMWRHVATDAEGRFTCPGVVPGLRAEARASFPGFARAETDVFSLDAGMAAEVTLRLQRARKASVRVLDAETGEPIAGAEVVVCPKRVGGWGYEMMGPRGRTDARGIVQLEGVPPGELGARAYAPGYVRDDNPKPLEGAAATGDVTVTFTLQAAMKISGVVRVPAGVPFDRVRVTLRPEPGSRSSWSRAQATPSKDEGRFEFRGQLPGIYQLSAEANWDQRRYVGDMTLKAPVGSVELELREGARPGEWFFRVEDETGARVAAHMIRFLEGERSRQADGTWVHEGFGVFGKTWNAKRLWVLIEGHVDAASKEPAAGSVLLGPLEHQPDGFDVVLPAERIVQGIVTHADGRPAAGLQIRAYVDRAAFLGPDYERLCRRVVTTDGEGRFTLRGLGALPYRLVFQPRRDGSTPAAALIDGRQTSAAITLDAPPDTVDVKVRTAAGKPAAAASMWLYPPTGPLDPIVKVQATADGILRVLDVDPDQTYRVVIWPGEAPGAAEFSGTWDASQREITLPASEIIRGEIRAPDGRVMERVQLWRRSAIGHWILAVEKGRGHFEIRVPPGRHRLLAVPSGERSPKESEQGTYVEAGATNVVVPFDPGPTLRFAFTDWPDPPAGFFVRAEGTPDAKLHRGRMNKSGEAEVVRLDAGTTYALWASPDYVERPDEQGLCVLLTGLAPDSRIREIRLERAAPAHGRVELPSGASGLLVRMVADVHGFRVYGRVKADGSFRVPGLPRGAWPLVVTLEHDGRTLQAETITRADAPMEITFGD